MTPVMNLPRQDWMSAAPTRRVVEALAAEGDAVRFVGGCVRDAIAGRPVKDIDLATPLAPEAVMRLLRKARLRAVPTGIAHGTVTAIADKTPFEITTLRVDVETFGRHATVAFTDDWEADAARRDFTFNALSCTPEGAVYDPFGGVDDLRAGRVRFVGDARARVAEDYLRLLRFFRFLAHYGREAPDPALLGLLADLAPNLDRLSGERLRDELFKLLRAADPTPVIDLMVAHGILRHVIPDAGDGAVLRALPPGAGEGEAGPDPVARLAALLPPDAEAGARTAARLRLSNREREALLMLLGPPVDLAPEDGRHARWRAVGALGLRLYGAKLALDRARRATAGEDLQEDRFADALRAAERLARQRFPLTGDDALAAGVPRGPAVGRVLAAVERWWAAHDFAPGRDACLEALRRRVAEGG